MAYWDDFTPTRPIAVSGGIKLQSRGTPKTDTWAGRWLASLESLYVGTRLQAGRTYARKGQVLSVDIEAARIAAKVQGSRPKPYDVAIGMSVLHPVQKVEIIDAVKERPLLIAKLLAGELPQEIADVFQERKIVLFPTSRKDLTTTCSCPDDANPCKHIAAVFAITGEQFDRDPFLILKLRGLERKDLLAALPDLASDSPANGEQESDSPSTLSPGPISPSVAPIDPATFWKAPPLPALSLNTRVPTVPAAVPTQLGVFPFWRGDRPLLDVLPDIYAIASQAAVKTLAGEPPPMPPASPVPPEPVTGAKLRGRQRELQS